MPTVVLVDGMTIANRSAVAAHFVKQFDPSLVEYFDCREYVPAHLYVRMLASALDNQMNIVIENSWRAQYILEALKEPTSITRPMLRMLDRIALGVNAQIAYCMADGRTYVRNVEAAGLPQTIIPQINKMHQVWETQDRLGLGLTTINTSDEHWTIDTESVMTKAKFIGRNEGPGIGAWKPNQVVLMVGDKHGPSIQPYKVDINLAFCDMAKAGSSYWLSQQLDKHAIPEDKLYWINAYDKDGEPTDAEFVARLKPISVISLGENATNWCDTFQIRHERFAHPQWHKRFQTHSPYPMVLRLKELINELGASKS